MSNTGKSELYDVNKPLSGDACLSLYFTRITISQRKPLSRQAFLGKSFLLPIKPGDLFELTNVLKYIYLKYIKGAGLLYKSVS